MYGRGSLDSRQGHEGRSRFNGQRTSSSKSISIESKRYTRSSWRTIGEERDTGREDERNARPHVSSPAEGGSLDRRQYLEPERACELGGFGRYSARNSRPDRPGSALNPATLRSRLNTLTTFFVLYPFSRLSHSIFFVVYSTIRFAVMFLVDFSSLRFPVPSCSPHLSLLLRQYSAPSLSIALSLTKRSSTAQRRVSVLVLQCVVPSIKGRQYRLQARARIGISDVSESSELQTGRDRCQESTEKVVTANGDSPSA